MSRKPLIIDCHGHYTTAPQALADWRDRQIAGIKDPSRMPAVSELRISDNELRESIELVGGSPEGFDHAVRVAVKRASESMRGLRWLEVVDQRAHIEGGDVKEFQVTVRVWFELEDQ